MPTYEFECRECGVLHEHVCSFSSKPSQLDCSCGGQAESIISQNDNGGFVSNRDYEFGKENCVVNFGAEYGRSVQQQHAGYQKYFGELKQRKRQLKRQGGLNKGLEWIGGMPGEMFDTIGLQEGDPEAVSKDPETFLKKTGMHADQE